MEIQYCANCNAKIAPAELSSGACRKSDDGKTYCTKCAPLYEHTSSALLHVALPDADPEKRNVTKFYFCETCGKRITDAQIEEGLGRDKKLKGVFCKDCATGVMTMEFDAIRNVPLNTALPRSQNITPSLPAKGIKGSGTHAAHPTPSTRAAAKINDKLSDRNAAHSRSSRRSPPATPAVLGAAVAGVVAVAGIVLFVQSSKSPAPGQSSSSGTMTASSAGLNERTEHSAPTPSATSTSASQPLASTPATTVASTPAPQEPVSTPPAPAKTQKDLDESDAAEKQAIAQFKSIDEYAAAGQLSAALKSLDDLKEKFRTFDWWSKYSGKWADLDTTLRHQMSLFQASVQEALQRVRQSKSADELTQIETQWKTKAQTHDETLDKGAGVILAAVVAAREQLARRTAEADALNREFEKYEKLAGSKAGPQEMAQISKFISEFETKMKDDVDLIEAFAERLAGLRFDASSPSDSAFQIYKVKPQPRGQAVELNYDFSNAAQFQAWNFENPGNCGGAVYDGKSKAIELTARGDHHPSTQEPRNNVPYLMLPFNFKTDEWSIQCEAEPQFTGKGSAYKSPHFGIIVAGEGAYALEFIVAQGLKPREWIYAAFPSPVPVDAPRTGVFTAVRPREIMRFNISCVQGKLSFAGSDGNLDISPLQLAFTPTRIGICIRSYDANEESKVLFRNIKFTGIPDRERMDAERSANRASATKSAKAEYLKQFKLRRLAADEAAGIPNKDWALAWSREGDAPGPGGPPVQGEFFGRKDVWKTHVRDPQTPTKWRRKVTLEAGKKFALYMDVSPHWGYDWGLVVVVNGKKLLTKVIAGEWQPIEVDLSEYSGQDADIEIWTDNANVFNMEMGYYDGVRISPKASK